LVGAHQNEALRFTLKIFYTPKIRVYLVFTITNNA
jgi:hypothetical protein